MFHEKAKGLQYANFSGAIPDHKIIRCIGEGAFGRVWLAVNTLGAYRAVKTIERSKFQSSKKGFEIEWEGIKKYAEISLSQPRMVAIFHVGRADDDSYFYYIMELGDDIAQGRNIQPAVYQPHTLEAQIFSLRKRLSIKECTDIGIHLSEALYQFHSNGLLHRDVKPANIIYAHGVPKLTDIGLVSKIDDLSDNQIGTEGFSPIEGSNSVASDIYSLGKTLYEAATGLDRKQFPTPPKSWKNTLERDAFAELNDVLTTACHPDVNFRYSNCMDMHSDLLCMKRGKSLRKYKEQEKTLENLKIVTKVSFAIFAVLIAIILVLIQKAQFEREFTNYYASQTIEGYTSLGLDENQLAIHKSIVPVLDNFTSLANSDPSFEDSITGKLFASSINDFPTLEYVGIIGEREKDGHSNYTVDGSGNPIALKKCIFSSDQKSAIISGENGFLAVFDIPYNYALIKNRNPIELKVLQKLSGSASHALAVHPELNYAYTAGEGADVNVYDISTTAYLGSLEIDQTESKNFPSDIKISPDGTHVGVSYRHGQFAVFDCASFQKVSNTAELKGPTEGLENIQSFEWGHSGKYIIAVGQFHGFKRGAQDRFPYCLITADKDKDGFINLEPLHTFKASTGRGANSIVRTGYSNEFILDNSDFNFYKLMVDEDSIDLQKGFDSIIQFSSIRNNSDPSSHLEFQKSLKLLAVIRNNGWLSVFQGVDTIRQLVDLPHPIKLNHCDISRNGRHIISVCEDGSFRLWDLAGAKVQKGQHADGFVQDRGLVVNYDGQGGLSLNHLNPNSEASVAKVAPITLGKSEYPIQGFKTSLDGNHLALKYTTGSYVFWGVLPNDSQNKKHAMTKKQDFTSVIESSPQDEIDFNINPFLEFKFKELQKEVCELKISNNKRAITISGLSRSSKPIYVLTPDRSFILVGLKGLKKRLSDPAEKSGPRIIVYNSQTLEKVSEFDEFEGWGDFTSISFSDSGKSVLFTLLGEGSEYNESALHGFDTNKGQIKKKRGAVSYKAGAYTGGIFSEEDVFITAGASSNISSVRILKNEKKLSEFFIPTFVDSINFKDDQTTMYFTSRFGGPYFWSLKTKSPVPLKLSRAGVIISSIYIPKDNRFVAGFDSNNNRVIIENFKDTLSITDARDFYHLIFHPYVELINKHQTRSILEIFESLTEKFPTYFYSTASEVKSYYEYLIDVAYPYDSPEAQSVKDFVENEMSKLY